GGAKQNQFLVWSLKDFHSQRPPATLTTARSKEIADALEIKDPTADARCTSCHAPLASVPENRRGENFKVSEGVSCESCHGPAENWLRSHTRTDYTRADRTAAGMRDLQNLYVRANVCVACHQNVDADILKAGHPELMFELDGQSVAEPKHWSAEKNGNGAQAWLVGQAVALREMSWQLYLAGPSSNSPEIVKSPAADRYFGLAPLISKISEVLGIPTPEPVKNNGVGFKNAQVWSDKVAIAAAGMDWSDVTTRKFLYALASSTDFHDTSVAQPLQAHRAERLVLALDRLVAALPELKNNEPVQSALNQLFQLAQSIPDFDSAKFAAALENFSRALARQ
ncbi:MAG TPA: multiheme c-type cytochrome, partial [Verrucomicrobiae bacterium]